MTQKISQDTPFDLSRGLYTRDGIRNAHLDRVDARGLMPLAEARDLLAGTTVFARGRERIIDGVNVTDANIIWAALLSLENAEEFVGVARRLKWKNGPAGWDNIALAERYREGILPWLADHVNQRGKLLNKPWCVIPCLLALEGEKVLHLLRSVKTIAGYDLELPRDPAAQALDLLERWQKAHPV